MKNIYGTVGYTFFYSDKNPHFILVLSDVHSKLKYCDNFCSAFLPCCCTFWACNKVWKREAWFWQSDRNRVSGLYLWIHKCRDRGSIYNQSNPIMRGLCSRDGWSKPSQAGRKGENYCKYAHCGRLEGAGFKESKSPQQRPQKPCCAAYHAC